ncbi:MAG: phospholipid carrier-dependent glycosyltransferase [Dactylosporangium sp.]|nr:phospholipid carrier-dependent glycosyltransferase [Dactylosporangium sp.]
MGFGLTRAPAEAITKTAAAGRQVPWPYLLAGGWLVQFLVRLPLIGTHRLPPVMPDETGYLMAARLLAGREGSNLSGLVLYQGGYPLLISPAYLITEDPQTAYSVALAINALIGAFLFPLAYAALRRLEIEKGRAYVVAMATALLPSALHHGQFALTDAVLPVIVLCWLLCAHSWLSHSGMRWAVAASALAAYTFAVHNRGVVIVVMHAALILIVLVRDWADKNEALAAAGMLAGGGVAGWLMNAWIMLRLYPGGAQALDGLAKVRLTSLDGWGWTLTLVSGKLWYLLVSTWGIAGVGLIAAVAVTLRGGVPRAVRATAALLVGTTAGIALATSAAIPNEGTVSNLLYGRYLSCVAPVFFLSGCAAAMRARRASIRWALLATAILAPLSAFVVWWYVGGRLSAKLFVLFDFPEMSVLTRSWHELKLGWSTCAVLPGLLALLLLRHRKIWPAALVAVIIAHCAVITLTALDISRLLGQQIKATTTLAPTGLTKRDIVAMDPRGMDSRVVLSHMFQTRTQLRAIDRYKAATLPRDVTLVIVPWNPKEPASKSWPTAPDDFSLIHAHNYRFAKWAAWRRVR